MTDYTELIKKLRFLGKKENQRYIAEYYRKNKLKSMPGFLGFGELSFPRKRIPKWCPLAESVIPSKDWQKKMNKDEHGL